MRLPNDDPDEADRLSGAERPGKMDPDASLLHTTRIEAGRLRRQVARLENAIRLASTLCSDPKVKAVLEDALDQKGRP